MHDNCIAYLRLFLGCYVDLEGQNIIDIKTRIKYNIFGDFLCINVDKLLIFTGFIGIMIIRIKIAKVWNEFVI